MVAEQHLVAKATFRMSTVEYSDIDSDLEDPDLEGLELLRKALGTHYTAVSPFKYLKRI